MLYQVGYNSKIAIGVLRAFEQLHSRKIFHGDVRVENILVRPDNTVVIIDFESSEMNASPDVLKREMEEVKSLLASLKPR
jgi:thiamine kinase-like enzyme